MASLKRIAGDLGVSYTLVSKVLSGRLGTTGVSAKTRAAILARAAELEYVPNHLAVALKAGRKGSVGIFLHGIGSPGSDVTDRLLGGLAEGLEKSGLRMLLRFFKTEEEFLAACDVRLRSEVDGLIVAGAAHPELVPKFLELEAKNVKVVSIFNDFPANAFKKATNVVADYELQGYLPTKHLLDQGLRRIACLDTVENRTQGFRRAFAEAKLTPRPAQFIRCKGFSYEDGVIAAEDILQIANRMEGVVCQSDSQALGLIHQLSKKGVRVPKEIKVTGVDNSPLARYCLVPITSVTSEMRPTGMKAVETLLQKIAGQKVHSTKLVPKLEVRESSI
ncbi:MAG: LacI family DNA-binding transcriptional regulator [Terrimicrobiaceae bacterium]